MVNKDVCKRISSMLSLYIDNRVTYPQRAFIEEHLSTCKECYKKYGLKAEETVLVDDRIYNQQAAIKSGAHPVRMRCEFTTDLPEELKWIPEVKDVVDFKNWLYKNTTHNNK